MKFKELNMNQEVLQAIEKLGYDTPTKIQSEIIPYIIEGKDVVGQSETGTGKTLAFAAGILTKLNKSNFVKVLVLTPTRELAIQVGEEIDKLAVFSNVKTLAVYGNSSIEKQINSLKNGVDIVVGTPGRAMDLIKRKKLNLENLQFFVLDEADEMLNMGFREDIEEIFKRTKREKQVLLFSATMQKPILKLAENYMKEDYEEISVVTEIKTAKNISQKYYLVNEKTRTESMCRVMDKLCPNKALIFCRTKRNVDTLYGELSERGYSVGVIHGDIAQNERISTLERFKKGTFNYLIATDVAARGIHVNDIEVVFNYNLPQDNESYVHRIGRTGRANKYGLAVTFVTPKEEKILYGIEKHIKTKITLDNLPNLEEIIPNRCNDIIKNIIDNKDNMNFEFEDYLNTLSKEELKVICGKLLNKELMKSLGSNFNKDLSINATKEKSTKTKNATNIKNKNSSKNDIRLFLTIGKLDNIDKKTLLAFLEKNISIPKGTLSKVEIMPKFTFLNVNNKYLDKLLQRSGNLKYGKRTINLEIAN